MNKPFLPTEPVRPREHVDLVRDLGTEDADELRVKFDLSRRIALEVEDRDLSQAAVAEMTGLKQPDISRITNGLVKDYSVWRLMRVMAALGHDVAIEVFPSGEPMGTIYTVDEPEPEAEVTNAPGM
ncbi:MAG: helix-turn-helix transcriptional regulator [Devosia sp.]